MVESKVGIHTVNGRPDVEENDGYRFPNVFQVLYMSSSYLVALSIRLDPHPKRPNTVVK
jgi:hypothetical protein